MTSETSAETHKDAQPSQPTNSPILAPKNPPAANPNPNPTEGLSEPQLAALSTFQTERLPKLLSEVRDAHPDVTDGELSSNCDTPCLLRYLRARNFDVTKAAAMLSATLKWRFGTYKPHTVTKEEVEQESGGNNYVSGFDKHARPIMYLKKRGVVKDPVLNVRLLMSMVEFAVTVMAPGVGQMVIIMDMKEYTWANRPPASVTMDTLNFLSNHYPERLGKCFIVDAPWVFSTLWNLVRPFLDPVTAAKISFITTSPDATKTTEKVAGTEKEILEMIDADQLERRYGGTLDYQYDNDVYWKKRGEVESASRS